MKTENESKMVVPNGTNISTPDQRLMNASSCFVEWNLHWNLPGDSFIRKFIIDNIDSDKDVETYLTENIEYLRKSRSILKTIIKLSKMLNLNLKCTPESVYEDTSIILTKALEIVKGNN